MTRLLFSLILVTSLLSCQRKRENTAVAAEDTLANLSSSTPVQADSLSTSSPVSDPATDSLLALLLTKDYVKSVVSANRTKSPGNAIKFREYTDRLNIDDAASIALALDFILTNVSANDKDRDAILLSFEELFNTITNRLSERLYSNYEPLLNQLQTGAISKELTIFQNNLIACGIGINTTEGNYYLDALPGYLYDNFKDRVSGSVREYLSIRKDEMTQGFSEDAGMLISFDQLYDRIMRWEKFISQYPDSPYASSANSFYSSYVGTLMTGMDNSRVFEFEDKTLLPEIKKLYERIIAASPATKTSQAIKAYYNFLSRQQFKENDSIPLFLEKLNLSTMLGVQPHTR